MSLMVNQSPNQGTAIMSPASSPKENNGRVYHVTWTYIHPPYNTQNNIDQVKAAIQIFARTNLQQINGHYSVHYDGKNPWGQNSLLLTGEIENFKQQLDSHLRATFPFIKFADYRKAHVDVRGNFQAVLYPTITATQLNQYP